MRRYFALALALAVTWPHVGFAKGKDKKDDAADSDDDDDKSDDAPKAKPKAKDKDKDAKDAKAKAKAKAKSSDDDDSDDDKPAAKDKDAKAKDAKAKAKAKPAKAADDDSDDDKPKDKDKDKDAKAKGKAPPKPAADDSDDDKDTSKFGGKKVTGADAVVTDDDNGGGGGDGSDSGSGGGSGDQPLQKQDLSGHDMGPSKKSNAFEQDRFFVDKRDDKKTEQGTLIQGSLTSTSLFYFESSGAYPTGTGAPPSTLGSDGSSFPELWTDLRLQTDFRHIAGGAWDARVDGRIRLVDNPGDTVNADTPTGTSIAVPNHIQSGLTGQNEYELRELWLARNGDRTDVFVGRQYIADLAAVKIDGIRIDYASSQTFTLLGFAGLFPVRGSRSLTTDYVNLSKDYNVTSQSLDPAGKLVTAGGFGAAYRTESAYGSFGGVAEIPIEGEGPRIFGTAQGYWRSGSKLDFYHFAVLDLVGSAGLNVTNLSLGLNYKPNPQLRLTASYNRYDTETLNVQANAFFNQPSTNTTIVQNQIFVSRLASNEARGSISAGLGNLQRFEITVAATYRERQPFTLYSPDGTTASAVIPPGSSVELYAALTDRRSVADLRLGADVLDSFAIGGGDDTAYQRADIFAARLYAGRELANGKGEWEADAEYSTSKDTNNTTAAIVPASPMANTGCLAVVDCYGVSNASVITIGGTLYYRFNRDWLGIATLYLSHTTLDSAAATITGATAQTSDAGITGLNGFFRIAYRF